VVTTDVKSRAGRRTVSASPPAIEQHREQQAAERIRVGDLWRDEGWVFTNRLGGPVHPTVNYDAWKLLLDKAKARTARLHDARHTATTMLLVLKVPLPAVMEIMGWSDASIAKRYMHVPREFLAAIADQVSGLVWAEPADDDDERDDGPAGMLVPVVKVQLSASPLATGNASRRTIVAAGVCASRWRRMRDLNPRGF
jgi:integrase